MSLYHSFAVYWCWWIWRVCVCVCILIPELTQGPGRFRTVTGMNCSPAFKPLEFRRNKVHPSWNLLQEQENDFEWETQCHQVTLSGGGLNLPTKIVIFCDLGQFGGWFMALGLPHDDFSPPITALVVFRSSRAPAGWVTSPCGHVRRAGTAARGVRWSHFASNVNPGLINPRLF